MNGLRSHSNTFKKIFSELWCRGYCNNFPYLNTWKFTCLLRRWSATECDGNEYIPWTWCDQPGGQEWKWGYWSLSVIWADLKAKHKTQGRARKERKNNTMQVSMEMVAEWGTGTYRGKKCHSKIRDSTFSLIKTDFFFFAQLKFILDHHWYSDTQRHTQC